MSRIIITLRIGLNASGSSHNHGSGSDNSSLGSPRRGSLAAKCMKRVTVAHFAILDIIILYTCTTYMIYI